jgi:hypothetical protein
MLAPRRALRIFKFKHKAELAEIWADHGDRIVAEHVADYPGTRPRRWWEHSAPAPRDEGESRAAYLERHALFFPGERKSLRTRPVQAITGTPTEPRSQTTS